MRRRRLLLRAALRCERGKILLPRRERIHFCSRGSLRVHCKPHRPDHKAHDTRGDVLRYLYVIFVSELLRLGVVCLYLGLDHGAVALGILRLHHGDRMRITACASGQGGADDKCRKNAALPAQQYEDSALFRDEAIWRNNGGMFPNLSRYHSQKWKNMMGPDDPTVRGRRISSSSMAQASNDFHKSYWEPVYFALELVDRVRAAVTEAIKEIGPTEDGEYEEEVGTTWRRSRLTRP